jgi:hypothetical protein
LQFSGGFGLQFGRYGFDYAILVPRQLMSAGAASHTVGLRVRFGGDGL